MDLDHVQAFLILSEELHFGRTAERMYRSQPRVSRLIASLEAEIGATLFERTNRRVSLTPLGADLEARLRPAYTELLAARDAARQAAGDTAGSLRLGVTVNTNRPSLARLIETFQSRRPECRIDTIEVDTWNPYAALREGHIDVLCGWCAVDEPDLTLGPVIEQCPRALVVGTRHSLASKTEVSAEDIASEQINRPPAGYPAALADAILVPATPSGHPIRRADEAQSPAQVATLIARGKLVSINVVGSSFFARDDITLIPITDLPPLPLGLIWSTARENARIRALAHAAGHTAGPATPGRTPRRPRQPAAPPRPRQAPSSPDLASAPLTRAK